MRIATATMIAILTATSANAGKECDRFSFVYGKLAVAAVQCDLPANHTIRDGLGLFLAVAKKACGGGDPLKWPGTLDGGTIMFNEIKAGGRTHVCKRLSSEIRELANYMKGNE